MKHKPAQIPRRTVARPGAPPGATSLQPITTKAAQQLRERPVCVGWSLLLLLLGGPLHAASLVQFSASFYNVAEGMDRVEIAIQRTSDLDSVVSVDFATTNLTATAGADYLEVSINLTFLARETNRVISVPILNDGLVEGPETFRVVLSNPTGGAALGACSTATVRIISNDKGLAIEYPSYWAREHEGSVVIGIGRGDDGSGPVTVEYATGDGTAREGEDYSAVAGRLEFAAGEKLKLIPISILNDGLKEINETFRLYLTNAAGTALGTQKSVTITIVDNDPGVQFEFNRHWVRESDRGLTLRVVRGNDVELGAFTVDYATTNGTATAGTDYGETKGTLQFAAAELCKFITVPIFDDLMPESDTEFRITLSDPSPGATLGTPSLTTAWVTILDTTGLVGHGFEELRFLPGQGAQLALGGSVHQRFKDYFDLYPIEVSHNLLDWAPLATLMRTNWSGEPLIYLDASAVSSDLQFYRTVTNHLITALLKPTGPYPVGVVSRLVSDPSRRNRYFVSTNGSFMTSIWYPAVAEAGQLPVPYMDEMLMRDNRFSPSLLLRSFHTRAYALPEAKAATAGGPYPVVVYSHGATVDRVSQVVGQAENLASHGYVVVSMDHYDARFTRFPDGTCFFGDLAHDLPVTGFRDRVRDVLAVLDELAPWNSDDPALAGIFDLTKVAAMGLSWGGEVAPEACRIDSRLRAVIMLDSYPSSQPPMSEDLVRLGVQKPLIGMYRPEYGGDSSLYDRNTDDAIFLLITGSLHLNFGDNYWWELSNPDLVAGREIARTIRAYMLWFLNKYLKGSTDPVPTQADYPRVTNFRQK